MRGLFRWAKQARHVTLDPTAGVKNPKRKKGPGFRKWTEADAEAYDRRWPIEKRNSDHLASKFRNIHHRVKYRPARDRRDGSNLAAMDAGCFHLP